MPFHRNFAKRHRKKFNRYKKCGKMAYSDASKALSIARSVQNMVNVEWKAHTVTDANKIFTSAVLVEPLSNIPRGDTTDKRDGASARIKWFTFNYQIHLHPSTPATSHAQCRIMVIWDKQTNQALFSPADLFADSANSLISPLNLNNSGRFQILYNKDHTLFPDHSFVQRKVYKKINIPIRFDNNLADITDLTRNSIALVCSSNHLSTLQPTITYNFRARFIDN